MGSILCNIMESCNDCMFRGHKTHVIGLENRLFNAETEIKKHISVKIEQFKTLQSSCCN
jgi:hypothetical protein